MLLSTEVSHLSASCLFQLASPGESHDSIHLREVLQQGGSRGEGLTAGLLLLQSRTLSLMNAGRALGCSGGSSAWGAPTGCCASPACHSEMGIPQCTAWTGSLAHCGEPEHWRVWGGAVHEV